MTVQFLRLLTAQIEGGPTFHYDGKSGDGFRIRFLTQQRDASTPNVLHLLISNLSTATSQPAFYENKRCKLSAGYVDGGEMLLFDGEIRQARDLRESVTDRVLELLVTDKSMPRNYAVAVGSLNAGHTLRDQAEIAFKAFREMGVKIGYICDLRPEQKFPRSFAYAGPAKNLLRKICMDTQTSWSIQNGTLQIVPNNKAKPGGAIVLNSQTGLLGWPIQTIQGIEGTALLNGRIVPTCLVKIDESSIQRAAIDVSYAGDTTNKMLPKIATDGLYKILTVSHRGDTRGNDFATDFIGIKNGDNIPVAMASRGIDSNYAGAASR